MVLRFYTHIQPNPMFCLIDKSSLLYDADPNCFFFFLTSSGGCSPDLPRWQSDQPGQVPGLHGTDPGSREGPVQVLGHPLPAGETSGCSDGRAGLEQSRVTREHTSSGVIPLALKHPHSLSSHSQL